MRKAEFDTIEDAIHEFQQGKVVIVVDDEDRENEGDLSSRQRNARQMSLISWQNLGEESSVWPLRLPGRESLHSR